MAEAPVFGHLVLKPTLACTANCRTCAHRRSLHREKRGRGQLALADWKSLFREIHALGATKLTLSGGEPTLYRDLEALIEEARSYGWDVGLNTNGSLIDDALVRRLHAAGLNGVSVSIYSATPPVHDAIRETPGLWEKAVHAVDCFARVRDDIDPSFRVAMQTLICKDNYRQFPDLLCLAYDHGACTLIFSYLEGDYEERTYLLDAAQVGEFKREVIPAAVRVVEESTAPRAARRLAKTALRGLYPPPLSDADYGAGVYRPARPCQVPSYACIVLADGDVLPCNMVEYTHEPVVGNLRDASFTDIWRGEAWADFRQKGFGPCRHCPVPEQVVIPVTRRPAWPWLQVLLRATPLRALTPRLKRAAYSSRRLFKLARRTRP